MKKKYFPLVILFPILLTSLKWKTLNANWIVEQYNGYKLYYTNSDIQNKQEYLEFIDNGLKSVQNFFDDSFKTEFDIYIHPNRKSLDSTWQKDWNMLGFESECWMVASGVNNKLDILSPAVWDQEACEHRYADKTHTQRLITHELVHVYHGQLNISPDFSDVIGIDWFIEGLATYASGQCDSTRINKIKNAVLNDNIPESLDEFWTGELRYGLSGSFVMFIDHKFGRSKLKELLKFNRKSEILNVLGTTETDLLQQWKAFIENL